ncbi:hypothetical protein F5050DRAFT_1895223 [Lentinula boryana]|uniref:Proteophosphoglycan ppg4 n=1 Tax=Lentinula boryana TaxID=40481 RepID=A0ABQ8QCN6_9AGAR|nr:hypothetical protein F5050DRAFT_1895223 [Lentinula boryana]
MAGANYMGGKRNAAKARVRDSTGRAQKRYFGAQRLNLAANRGTTGRFGANDLGSTLGSVKTNGPTRSISDIKLAHARQHSSNTDNQITGYIPAPIRISPCTPNSKMRLSKISEDSSGSGPRRVKRSKVLQALDTCEPIALRAAMDKILLLQDLAGLSRRSSRGLKRPHSSSSPCPRDESNKRRRTEPTPHLLPSSDDSTPTKAEASDIPQESHSDLEPDGPQFSFNVPEDGGPDENDERSYSSDTNISTTWTVYPNSKTLSSGKSHHSRSDSSSNHYLRRVSVPKHNALDSSYHAAVNQVGDHSHISNPSSQKTLESNIFDYEDPWMAVGIMLGVEKTPESPLKKRDFRKMLAEIPTPMSTPSSNNVFAKIPTSALQDSTARTCHSSSISRLPVFSPTFKADLDTAQDSFGIFSPPTRTRSTLPNIFNALVQYSSNEATSKPPSSPTRRLHDLYSGPWSEADWEDDQTTMIVNARAGSDSSRFSAIQGHVREDEASNHEGNDVSIPLKHAGNEAHDHRVDLDDDSNANRRQRAASPSPLFSSPLFGTSCYSLSSREQHEQDPSLRHQQDHEQVYVGNIDQSPTSDDISQFQEANLSRGNEGPSSSPLITPMRFAPPPVGSNFDPDYGHLSLPGIAQRGDEYLRTPEKRTTGTSRKDTGTPHVGPVRRSNSVATPYRFASRVEMEPNISSSNSWEQEGFNQQNSSPSMHAFHASNSQPNRSYDRVFTLASNTADSYFDPRMKLSTELDTSLHRAPAKYRSPAPRPISSTKKCLRAPLTIGKSPLVSRSNASRVALASPPVHSNLFSNSSSSTCSIPRNYAQQDLYNEFNLQDAHKTEDKQKKMGIVSPATVQVNTPVKEAQSVDAQTESAVSLEKRSEKAALRAKLCFSLFTDDDVESDTDD